MTSASTGRKYRASEKRVQTRQQNSADIQAAAWRVFCSVGMDGANVRDIVKQSGLSPGTFYNYFKTKEAIFDVVAQDLFERLGEVTQAARAQARTLEELVDFAYRAYLDFVQTTEGAMEFIGRNQHHLRSQIYPSEAISAISRDLEHDLRRFISSETMSDTEIALFAAMMIAAGAEALFCSTLKPRIGPTELLAFLRTFILQGSSGWVSPQAPRPFANDA